MDFMAKKMLGGVKAHTDREYAADSAKPYRGIRKTVIMRDGFEAEFLFFAARKSNAPLLVDFYGGGYIGAGSGLNEPLHTITGIDHNTLVAASLSLNDAYDALLSIYNDTSIDFDRDSIIVEGHSAGAHLAASLALYNISRNNLPVRALILDYPIFDVRRDSLKKLPKVKYGIQQMVFEFMYYGYYDDEQKAADPLSSQILAADELLKKLPPSYINTCEHDSLKFGAGEFHNKIKALGCDSIITETKGAVHGYVEQCSNDSMKDLKDYPDEMNKYQYVLYEETFKLFCAYIRARTA